MNVSPPDTPEQALPTIEGWDAMPFAWGGPVGPGTIRTEPEDFQVVEVPLVEPCGEGEHCWLYVRKRNSNTQWVARQLAKFAGVSLSAVSYAGLKDRRAVTEQWFSVQLPGRPDPDWNRLADEHFEVLGSARHLRKLKTGALRGNRFILRIRHVQALDERVETRLQQLADGGFPNAFGAQRFGHGGANLGEAARLFRASNPRLSRHKRGLYLSAARSALFNRVLAARIEDACWNSVLPGDALQLQGKSACFVASHPDETIRQRVAAMELHPTGPLCGDGEMLIAAEAEQYEARQLRAYSAWIDGLKKFRLTAARRALRAIPGDLTWRCESEGNWIVKFFLPSGCYATSLLREVFQLEDGE